MRWFSIAVCAKSILVSVLASKSRRSPLDSLSRTPYTCAALALLAVSIGARDVKARFISQVYFMSIIDYIAADQVMVGVVSSSKKQLIEQLAERGAVLTGISQRSLFEMIMRRERLGSTAIGDGIAIPHAVHGDLTRTIGIIAVLATPIDFDAADKKPVDIVCLVIGPQDADSDHLKCVSSVAKSLGDVAVRNQLRQAKTAEALLQSLEARSDVAA